MNRNYGCLWQIIGAIILVIMSMVNFFRYKQFNNPGYDLWNVLFNLLLAGSLAIPYDAPKRSFLYYIRWVCSLLALFVAIYLWQRI